MFDFLKYNTNFRENTVKNYFYSFLTILVQHKGIYSKNCRVLQDGKLIWGNSKLKPKCSDMYSSSKCVEKIFTLFLPNLFAHMAREESASRAEVSSAKRIPCQNTLKWVCLAKLEGVESRVESHLLDCTPLNSPIAVILWTNLTHQ